MLDSTPNDALVTLRAGGIAPRGTKFKDDEPHTAASARAYTHPALAGRTIVCLAPDATALGVDAEMSALGFGAPTVEEDVGIMRFRTLGFPAWALVNDPKRARFALEVTQDLRRANKRIATKPGHAKEAFDVIGKKLGRTVPHFLPSFWEEAGRALAEEGAKAMAAQCFEKAREAERAHKLKVDEAARDAVFVEFALLGAVAAKTLSAYAKDLEKSAGAKDAYRRFLVIVVERALGGMPPWSGMSKDLRGLAKAAKLDPDASDDDVVRKLLETPSLRRAPSEFWTSYRECIVRVASKDTALQARLRAVLPEPRTNDHDAEKAFIASWLTLLAEAHALEDIPASELAGFMSRLIAYAGSIEPVKQLLRDVAPRLREPITVTTGDRWYASLDLDMAELALSLGVALAEPEAKNDGDDDHDASFSDEFTCDPVHVAADARYGKKLARLVDGMMGEPKKEALMRGKVGFVAARRAWLEAQIDALESGGLYRVKIALAALEEKTTAATFLPYPDLHARLAKVVLAGNVAVTLRGGIVDELTWPAYEKAFAKLGDEVSVDGAFPYVVLRDKVRAVVIGPEGVALEHDFVVNAKKVDVEHTFFIDGQLLVFFEDKKDYKDYAYWSGKPKDRFESRFSHWGDFPSMTTLADGSVTLGAGIVHAGDTKLGVRDHCFDGTTLFVENHGADAWGTVELDPRTEKKGRVSKPRFFEEYVADGWKLLASSLYAVPATRSPLGVKNGLSGVRVRTRGAVIEAERIDNVSWAATTQTTPTALLTVPGDGAPRALCDIGADNARFSGGSGRGALLHAPNGELLAQVNDKNSDWASRGWGTVIVPPIPMWHFFASRDEAGSKVLRALDAEAALSLLEIARKEIPDDAAASGRVLPKTEKAARGLGIQDAALARGVAGVLEQAVALEHRLRSLSIERSKEAVSEAASDLGEDGQRVRRLADALARGKVGSFDFEFDVRPWLLHARGRAALALGFGAKEEQRAEARGILAALAGSVFEKEPTSLRLLELENDDADYEWGEIAITKVESSVFALHGGDDWAIERSTDGKFRPFAKGWKQTGEKKIPAAPSAAFAKRWCEAEAVAPSWDPAAVLVVTEKTGLPRTEALLLLLGAPLRNYDRDFLGKALREQVDVKVGDADKARDVLKSIDKKDLLDVYAAAVADDPMVVREPLAWAGRLAEAWRGRFGKRLVLPEDVVAAAQRDLELGKETHAILSAFADPSAAPFFKKPTITIPELSIGVDLGANGFDLEVAEHVLPAMLWLSQNEPVGSELRAGIPAILAAMTKTLQDPKVVWRIGEHYSEKDNKKDIKDLLACVGGSETTFPKEGSTKCEDGRDSGGVLAAIYDESLHAAFRPGKIAKADEAALRALTKAMCDGETDPVQLARLITSPELALLAARVTDTPLAVGSFEANPLLSAPKIVAAVKKTHSVSDEAAALYLMLLALSEPTDRAVRRFTGWTPKVLASAGAELVKKKLAVAGKRARWGREVFLPGGFDKGSNKNLPMEEWKAPFYPPILARRLAREVLHALFARAWKRVEADDAPRFEKVR